MNIKLGLKLWSTNHQYAQMVKQLYGKELFDYIELFIVPDSYKDYLEVWKNFDIPYIIHAPTFGFGFNLADRAAWNINFNLFKQVQKFCDKLNATKIIVHLGIEGNIKEADRQLKMLNDERILIENTPWKAVVKNKYCLGAKLEDLEYVLKNNKVGFCLDFGHAVFAANALKKKPIKYIEKLLQLKPEVFHLTDGDYRGVNDCHYHIGRGSFPIRKFLSLLPASAYVTLETKKNSKTNLDDYVDDVNFLKTL